MGLLRELQSSNFSPEHDVAGITDPFLQVKILRFLRVLGRDSDQVSEAINDILAQVATNTDASKIVGNSILYECVLTILEVRSDPGLRVMAINLLGKFLGNQDNNIRYVALNTLSKVVALDTQAVQRHRATILECLRDADISIRRRALELTYMLIDEHTVQALMKELLQFLKVADTEFKLTLTTRISIAAERFAPSQRWHLDTMLQVLRLAGNHVRDDVLAAFLRLVCHATAEQSYVVQRLYAALHADMSQSSQTLVAVWVLGEFGELLFEQGRVELPDGQTHEATPAALLELLSSLLESVYATPSVREYVLTALAKLHTRIQDPTQQQRITSLLAQYRESIDTETQKRALEYQELLRQASIRDGVLEPMPIPEMRKLSLATVADVKTAAVSDPTSLLDMAPDSAPTPSRPAPKQSAQDLLADLFGGDDTTTPAPQPAPAPTPAAAAQPATTPKQDLLGLLDATPARKPVDQAVAGLQELTVQAPPAGREYDVYHQRGLHVTMTVEKHGSSAVVQARFKAEQRIDNLALQAAVPKTQVLQMSALSSASVAPGGMATQELRLSGLTAAPIRLRLRLAFSAQGEAVREQVDWTQP